MNVIIRLATPTDYPAIVDVGWRATADYGLTVADLRFAEQQRAADTVAGRFVAVTPDQQIIGAASYAQSAPKDEPRRFNVWFHVLPQYQGQDIGKRLYERVMAELTPHGPHCLETGVRTDLPRAVRFLADRGFTEVMRECETHLELATFEPDRFVADLQRMAVLGLELKMLTELNADEERDAKLYQLHRHQHETAKNTSAFALFDEWRAQFWQLPHLHADAFCVAVAGDQYVGHSHALVTDSPELIYGYTGVLPAYRNQGIARAMKICVLQWAKAQGYTRVRSWSDSHNKAMIRVNLHLGFRVQPSVLWMEKKES